MEIQEIKSKLNSYNSDISSLENEYQEKKNELEQLEKSEEKVFNEKLKPLINEKIKELKAKAEELDTEQKKKHDEFFKEIKEIRDIVDKVSINYFDIYNKLADKIRTYIIANM